MLHNANFKAMIFNIRGRPCALEDVGSIQPLALLEEPLEICTYFILYLALWLALQGVIYGERGGLPLTSVCDKERLALDASWT